VNPLPLLALAALVQADSSEARPVPGPMVDRHAPGWFGFDSIPEDTYLDQSVQEILRLALSERDAAYEGIESYEAVMSERIYAGVGGWRFRRERGLFTQERVARIRWERGGDRVVQWIGARRSVPLLGDDEELQREVNDEIDEDLVDEGDPPALYFNPWDRRIVFGDETAHHPLADSAAFLYRYASGDTLRVRLPDGSRDVTLVEVRVQPRFVEPDLVAGSLWFDEDSGALVRGTFKPARPWSLEIDAEDDEADDVPGFLKPIEAEIDYVTVDYSLHELRYWLPRRFGAEAELRISRFVNFPVLFEWTVGGYRVNDALSDIPIEGPLPAGWTRSETRVERDGEQPYYVTVLVPSADSLLASPELPEPVVSSEPQAFSADEIAQIRSDLDDLVGTQTLFGPRIAYGLQDGMLRYNRIEALSAGVSAELPVPPSLSAYGMVRLGFDLEPNAEISLRRGLEGRRLSLTGFRRLVPTNEWEDPAARLLNVVDGQDDGQYYRALGGEVTFVRAARRTRTAVLRAPDGGREAHRRLPLPAHRRRAAAERRGRAGWRIRRGCHGPMAGGDRPEGLGGVGIRVGGRQPRRLSIPTRRRIRHGGETAAPRAGRRPSGPGRRRVERPRAARLLGGRHPHGSGLPGRNTIRRVLLDRPSRARQRLPGVPAPGLRRLRLGGGPRAIPGVGRVARLGRRGGIHPGRDPEVRPGQGGAGRKRLPHPPVPGRGLLRPRGFLKSS
jgi:hypothetical protein